jgi:hypothetical protein
LVLRDFIYLDAERLRSFAAQILGGVPEEEMREKGHELGGEAAAEAGLWRFVRAQGGMDYRYHRTATETRSMHHQVYSLFEEAIQEEGLLQAVDEAFDFDNDWLPETFADGSFVKVRGLVRCTDYGAAIDFMESFPTLIKAFKVVQMQNIKNALEAGEITAEQGTAQRRELNEVEQFTKSGNMGQLTVLGRTLYKQGEVRVKVRPSGAAEEMILAGVANTEFFLDGLGAGGITQTPPDTEWVVVGQISAAQKEGDLPAMPTGNGMEDAFEAIGASLREVMNVGTSAVFPAMEILPLAIYREVAT